MWRLVTTFILTFLPWLIEKLRREELEKKLERENKEAVDAANNIRAGTLDDELLVDPKERVVRSVPTNLPRKKPNSPNAGVSENAD